MKWPNDFCSIKFLNFLWLYSFHFWINVEKAVNFYISVSEIRKGPAKDRIKNAKTDESSDEEEYVPRSVLLKKKRQKEAADELKQQAKIPKICNDAWVQEKVKGKLS